MKKIGLHTCNISVEEYSNIW